MSDKILFIGNKKYPFDLILSQRKTATIYVTNEEKIIVKAPLNVSFERIDAFVNSKKKWILKQLEEIEKYRQAPDQKRFLSGSPVLYLGRQYKLVVQQSADGCEQVKLAKNQIFVFTKQNPNDDIHNGSLIQMWYDEQRRKIFKERFLNVSLNFPEAQKLRLSVAKMKSRWGSYRTDGTVVLHPDLIKASKQCIDYVLTHEFCHHYHKRHDEDFYRLLDKKMPDWKNIKEKLELRFAKN